MTEGYYTRPTVPGPIRTQDIESVRPELRLDPTLAAAEQARFETLKRAREEAYNIPAAIRAAGGLGGSQTFGLAPAIGAKVWGLDPDVYDEAMASPAAMAGEAAGFIGSALLTSGEAALARGAKVGVGAVGRGLIGGAVGADAVAERLFLQKLGPQLSARLGQPLTKVLGRAVGGGVGAGLHAAGTKLGHDMVHDVPLSGQAIAAEGLKGLLIGGALSGGISAIGEAATAAGRAVSRAASRGVSREAVAVARAGQVANLTEAETSRAVELFGSEGAAYKSMRETLSKAGQDFTATPTARLATHKAAVDNSREVMKRLIADIGVEADGKSIVGRINERLRNDILRPAMGTINQGAAAAEVESVSNLVKPLAGVKDFAKIYETADMIGDMAGPGAKLSNQSARIVHNEIARALTDAAETVGKGAVAESVKAANASLFINRWAAAGAERSLKQVSDGAVATSDKLGMLGAGLLAATSHPVSAIALAGRTAVNALARRSPAQMAESAWQSAFGAGAAKSAFTVTDTAKSVASSMFRASKTGGRALSQIAAAEAVPAISYTRSSLERSKAHADTILSGAAQRAVSETVGTAGSEQMHNELLETFERARRMIQHHYPMDSRSALTLRDVSNPKGIGAKEGKFMRIHSAISDPVGTMKKISSGKITRDEMMAIKYVYPAIHQELAKAITDEIQVMKSAGKGLSVEKVAKLGIVMDAAVDTILEKDFISAIQSTMAAPAKPGPAPQPKPFDQTSLMTPTDKGIYR